MIDPATLISCESVAAVVIHLRVLAEAPVSYSGHPWKEVKALCTSIVAWDMNPPRAVRHLSRLPRCCGSARMGNEDRVSETKIEYVDFYNLIARERGCPEGWKWMELSVLGTDYHAAREHGAFEIKGGVCAATFKSGVRKGQPNWSKATDKRSIVITFKDLDAFMEKWSKDTGLCSKCTGNGKTIASCGVNGTAYRGCSDCAGTGKLQEIA